MIHTSFDDIDKAQWKALIDTSPVATWFQTEEAYRFYAALPDIMTPFCIGVSEANRLSGVIVGYVTKEKNPLKQFFTRRAIIIGGPLLSEDITESALTLLLNTLSRTLARKAIYIETRNFNDYSRWRSLFEQSAFTYHPHLNFHVDTTSLEGAQANVGKHRWKYIRLSLRDGATIVEHPTLEQVRQCYDILETLYKTKVHTPLFPWEFFEKLYRLPSAHFLLVELEGVIIGGSICVGLEGKVLYEWFVCGDEGYRKGIRPSSVATWGGIKYAAENAFSRFDLMGAGKPDEPYGVREFKAEFGGTLVEHGRYLSIVNKLLYKIGTLGVKLLRKY